MARSCSHLGVERSIFVAGLEFRVSANVLLVDEHVRDSALASLLLEGVLDLSAVGQLIKLNEVVLNALVLEEILGERFLNHPCYACI